MPDRWVCRGSRGAPVAMAAAAAAVISRDLWYDGVFFFFKVVFLELDFRLNSIASVPNGKRGFCITRHSGVD